MFGPRSDRECERGVSVGVGFDGEEYEKRFLCGVEGVKFGAGKARLAGGVFEREPVMS